MDTFVGNGGHLAKIELHGSRFRCSVCRIEKTEYVRHVDRGFGGAATEAEET